jgi:chromosome segregation ATPase
LSSERDWYQDQYNSLDALMEALRTDNGWLEYRLKAVRDELLDQGAQTAEGASAVDMVRAALVVRDEALQKVREDLAAMQAAAAERETTLTSRRPSSNRTVPPSRGHDLGKARSRRRPKRPSS